MYQLASNVGIFIAVALSECHLQSVQDELGLLRRRGGPRWCVPWDQTIEADCRDRIARSGHLNPTGPGARPLPGQTDSEISVQEAAARLAVPADAVYYWIRTRRLDAHRTGAGRLSIPWNDEVAAGCRQLAARSMHFSPTTQTTTAGGAV